jgi:hypothetical protein
MSGQLHAPAALTARKDPPVHIQYEVRWTPQPVWTIGEVEILESARTRSPTLRASRPQTVAIPTELSTHAFEQDAPEISADNLLVNTLIQYY